MEYTVKTVSLYKDLLYSTQKKLPADFGNSLYRYTCGIQKNDLNPRLSLFLTRPKFAGYALVQDSIQKTSLGKCEGIAAGCYLFVQTFFPGEDKQHIKKQHRACLQAAEHLYLESLWRELDFCDNTVYVRKLEKDDKCVLQLFRKIAGDTFA